MPVLRNLKRLALLSLASWSLAAAAEPSFVPVHRDNFPDPHIVLHNGEFIAYATNDGINLPMLRSRNLVDWSPVTGADGKRLDGMPVLASWVQEGRTWAPEVMRVGSKWLLYYTAHHRARKVQCIGVAAADQPTGPFRDSSAAPLVCQYDEGGTIDANPFRDADGKLYLYYKSDGNAVGKTTFIWGQPLAPDGLSVVGSPVPLVKDDAEWEWRLVEAPAMVRAPGGGYQMFYSAAFFGWDPKERLSRYATGYANCSGPLGPCKDAPENPILNSFNDRQAGCLSGPGHPAIFQVGQRHFIAFHAWAATSGCRKAEDERYLYIAPLFWKGGKPTIGMSLRGKKPGERG
ncbi:MAG TPA: glycoside hydrolase family 43 protein [Sphingomicrobium sp.]|nr:glycoside hydrolase family 43 protein [Sphingomicrobium sp.]